MSFLTDILPKHPFINPPKTMIATQLDEKYSHSIFEHKFKQNYSKYP